MSYVRPSIRMPTSPTEDDEIASMAAAAWHKRGWLCIRLDALTDAFDRQWALNLGRKLYGPTAGVHSE